MDKKKQDEIKEYFDKLHQEGLTPWKSEPPEPLLLKFLEEVKREFPNGKVLDIGCGDGWISIKAAQASLDAWGLDGSPTAIDKAREAARVARVEHKVHFTVGDAISLPYSPDFFDAIIDRGLYHHIIPENRSVYLQNVLKVLKPHGLAYLAVFSMKNPPHIGQRFSRQEIIALFGSHFDMKDFSEDPHPTDAPAHLYHFILRKK